MATAKPIVRMPDMTAAEEWLWARAHPFLRAWDGRAEWLARNDVQADIASLAALLAAHAAQAVAEIKRDLRDQWESNHYEHCGKTLVDGHAEQCRNWPLPDSLRAGQPGPP